VCKFHPDLREKLDEYLNHLRRMAGKHTLPQVLIFDVRQRSKWSLPTTVEGRAALMGSVDTQLMVESYVGAVSVSGGPLDVLQAVETASVIAATSETTTANSEVLLTATAIAHQVRPHLRFVSLPPRPSIVRVTSSW